MFSRDKLIRPVIKPVIKDVITPATPKKEEPKKLTPYHKAVLRVLHNRAISSLANGNDAIREEHKREAVKIENDLPLILRKHPATAAEIADAKKQRITIRNIDHHLSELDRLSK